MEVIRINTDEIIKIKLKIKNPEEYLKKDDSILMDEYFKISLYTKNKDIIRKVYIPYDIKDIKNCFVIIELIETDNQKIIVRIREKNLIDGYKINKKDLDYYIKKHSKYYTTISTEGNLINYDFEINESIVSIIHFFYHSEAKVSKIEKIALIKDPSNTLKGAEEETEEIYQFLSKIGPIKVSLYKNIDSITLEKILSTYDIVHISAHIEEKGLLLKDGYYNPWKQNKTPSLIFLDTCKPSLDFLEAFIRRMPANIVYNNKDIEDKKEIEAITNFYKGIIAGYRIGDVIKKVFGNKKRIYGWLTNRFII